jgi:NAD(P)-dependent dehydrogenase (short-subunit alcohol dehydrogenase family)
LNDAIFRCEIGSSADRAALLAFARERFGRLDLLVNNAGMAPRERRDILEATEESFDELISTNLKGPHFLTQAAARWMAPRGEGRVVFVTSISAYTASVNRGEYCISKAGLSMAVALWAARMAECGVKVFEIRPGVIRTEMTAPVAARYGQRIAEGLSPHITLPILREDEIAAESMGIYLFKHKIMSFVIGAFFAGIGGGLMSNLIGAIDPLMFRFTTTYNILLIIVLGGMGSITGTIISAFIITIAQEGLRFLDETMIPGIPALPGLRMVVFSVLLMVVVLFFRNGLMGTREFSWNKLFGMLTRNLLQKEVTNNEYTENR